MRPQTELESLVVEFVSHHKQSIFELCGELESLGMHGAKIPKMRADKWRVIVQELLNAGRLAEKDGCVVVPVVQKTKQMELFE